MSFGSRAIDGKYKNKRAEMWGLMKEWLSFGKIPNSQKLIQELTVPIYFFDAGNRLCLEPKEEIKKRLGSSPDFADSLALTFAYPVMQKSALATRVIKDYNPFENMSGVIKWVVCLKSLRCQNQ